MAWISHVMILDDDPRVLDSLVPSFSNELRKGLDQCQAFVDLTGLQAKSGTGPSVTISAYGYNSDRLRSYRYRTPHQLHVHLVREQGGRFDEARRLLNQQLFSVVVSDLRFSDDAGGLRAGKLFVEEVSRVHPEAVGILYSAYPRPEGFPVERFVRKGGEDEGEASLADVVRHGIEHHLNNPAVAGFAHSVLEQGLVYQSESFGTTLAQVFKLAQLMGTEPNVKGASRMRRPLPCVLLDGESGTGKRGLAAVFHAASDRRTTPFVVASCNELTNETLLRSILFGHKRGAYTDAREDRQGLVSAAGRGVLLLDDLHRLPPACSAIVHSFLEDGEYSRLGEEETRRQAECAVVLSVETGPWRERRHSGELSLAFLARVERLPIEIAPLRERPDDIVAQAMDLVGALSRDLGVSLSLDDDVCEKLRVYPFADSNSRELRNVIEQAVYRHYRECDVISWSHVEPLLTDHRSIVGRDSVAGRGKGEIAARLPSPALNEWQRRLRVLAVKILARGLDLPAEQADSAVEVLFDQLIPQAWSAVEAARSQAPDGPTIPMPVWEDLWRCFAVHWLGGPTPAEKVLGIPANTLRQWINDREAR